MNITTAQIKDLVEEPKLLDIKSPKEINKYINSNDDQVPIVQFHIDIKGINNRFRLIWRQHNEYRYNFSIGLMYLPNNHNDGPYLRRYNGKHLSPHFNPLEGTTFQNEFHIHEATERYSYYKPKGGKKKIERYATPTSRYQTPSEAFKCLLRDCNIEYPFNIQRFGDDE